LYLDAEVMVLPLVFLRTLFLLGVEFFGIGILGIPLPRFTV